jgi:hypothetical protein
MNVQQNGVQMAAPVKFQHALDLSRVHRTFSRGDVLLMTTWLRTEDGWEACLVLVNKSRFLTAGGDHVIPCVIPLSRAYAWASETCDELNRMVSAGVFAANLGFSPFNKKNVTKIIGLVEDHLRDLLSTPPRSAVFGEKVVTAEMEVIDNATGKIREHEVMDDHGTV